VKNLGDKQRGKGIRNQKSGDAKYLTICGNGIAKTLKAIISGYNEDSNIKRLAQK
jgi:hypothetical protein